MAKRFDFAEREPFGVKYPRVRALVSAAIESGDSSKAGMLKVPGGAMFEMGGLVNAVRECASKIQQPVLLVHPRDDDRASIQNSFWLQRNLAGTVDMVVLDDSYHVLTVDRQRHLVTDRTIAFADTITRAQDELGSKVVNIPLGAGQGELSAA